MMNVPLLELWEHMGLSAQAIVVVLLVMSVASATIAIQKVMQFRRLRRATVAFARPFSKALASDDVGEAQRLVERHPESHLAAALGPIIPMLQADAPDAIPAEWEISAVERLTELSALDQLAELRRGLGILATTGATAPFAGLLGTVVGVVNAFRGIGAMGTGGLGAITQGIAEALITTAIGLVIAIPAIWLYNCFVDRMELLSMEISFSSKELIEFMLRERVRARGRARQGAPT